MTVAQLDIRLRNRSTVGLLCGTYIYIYKAEWSTRQTCGGFSVFFFWPMSPAKSARNVSTRKKRKRRRRSTKRTDKGTQCLVARHNTLARESSSSSERTQGNKPDVLVNDHPAGSNTNADSESEGVSSPELDLAALNDVVYEEQEGEPGVKKSQKVF